MNKVEQIKLPTFKDERGPLTVIELKDFLDFEVKRIYYVTDVKAARGGHAVKHEKKMYVCQYGSCMAKFHDGEKWIEFEMKGPDDAIVMKEMCFREFYNFSEDAVLMAISSVNFVAEDYIYDLDEFINYVKK
ncbi:hypothetical protein COU74_03185 [Candidatus Peregrinibacteria bacterium CG10_big_fil_rev_8_21_14_0_10_36_19]|nr:MAG: hypothetical protein COU74_03185 [Candidatus Peregrinibacteria bacterium CG10_big_fil_rev_8_21_14_0_10_36_19]